MKILLLNPPSDQKHLRGNYCSNVSKGFYYYPAIDLLVQSGILDQPFDITICDAIAERKRENEVLNIITREKYDGIYAVTGSSSRPSDLRFFQKIKEIIPTSRLLVSGGYLLTQAKEILEITPSIDGILLDFTSHESIAFFRNEKSSFLYIATNDSPLEIKNVPAEKEIHYPTPRHDLFPLSAYNHPNARHHPISVVLHSSGCPE